MYRARGNLPRFRLPDHLDNSDLRGLAQTTFY